MALTVAQIQAKLRAADEKELAVLERSLVADTRKGVCSALDTARRRIEAEKAERNRLESLYRYELDIADAHQATTIVGLDEVGRGSIAGPLAVGAVVLDHSMRIEGLNDSKQVKPEQRTIIAEHIKQEALAWAVAYIEPDVIDAVGMTASLVSAFRSAVAQIEAQGIAIDIVLLDGNPLKFDKREVNIIKGDAKCASIAAASIVSKVERDALMCKLDADYPEYHWAECKGYASPAHIEAIKTHGLSPLHRVSFCTAFTQESLF